MESRDFSLILLKMIIKYCEKNNINHELIDDNEYDLILKITDKYDNWSWLCGYHKIVRVSPFGNGDKVHTSLSKIYIDRLVDNSVNVDLKDIRFDYFKATGAGGQHRNKTMSAVRATHIPTKIFTVSSASRSQHDNKKYAIEQLEMKLFNYKKSITNKKIDDSRSKQLEKKQTVLSFYFNHGFVINDLQSIKTTKLKDVLSGKFESIKN